MKSLSFVLQEFKLYEGLVSSEHDQQFIQWMVAGLRKLRQMGQYDMAMKSVMLPINWGPEEPTSLQNFTTQQDEIDSGAAPSVTLSTRLVGTANLPQDFESLVQIGLCRGGRFINLDRNNALCAPDECPCKYNEEQIAGIMAACCDGTNATGAWPFWAYPMWGEPYSWSYSSGSYGQGPGFYNGGYKIEMNKQRILFDQCVKSATVQLVYFGDFMTDTGNALVPDDFVEILIAWMDYMRCRFSPDPMRRREEPGKRNTWYQAVRDYNSINNQSMNRDAWLKLFRRLSYMGVKA